MASEARGVRDFGYERFLCNATVAAYELIQTPTGKAGYYDSPVAAASGDYVTVRTSGTAVIKKGTGFQGLKGGRVFWDHSANQANYKKANDRDFYAGRWAADSAQAQDFAEVLLNEDPPYDIDISEHPHKTALVGNQLTGVVTQQIGTRAKVGGTSGWVVGAANDLPYFATLAASQTAATLVIPLDGLTLGDVITGFTVVAQVESAGNTVTIDAALRATTNVAADPTDASIGAMTQVSVTADTAVSQAKTGLTETVTSGKTYYLLVTATTAASTDIILQACEFTVSRPVVGSSSILRCGGANLMALGSANEAQKVDILSADGFDTASNAIIEMVFRVSTDSTSAVDFNLGVASGTHQSDADSIAEYMFVHLDGDSTNIYVQSEDGTTTVAAADTTSDYTESEAITARVEVWFDLRDPADVQVYVDGVQKLPGSVFDLSAAAGPLYLLAHLEKTAATAQYMVFVDSLRARFAEQ